MKLDERILPGKRPLTCFDTEEARKFEGKEGYFSDYPRAFADGKGSIEQYATKGILKLDEYHENCPYIDETTCLNYPYFLPAEWVKEPERKYRPFSIEDWKCKHSIGETILYRYKGTYCGDHSEAELAYLGYIKPLDGITDEAGKGQIVLGNNAHGLQNLFDNYEMCVDGDWIPFGFEVEE